MSNLNYDVPQGVPQDKLDAQIVDFTYHPPRLVFSELENQEGVLGAIHVALEAVYREPLKI